MNKKDKIEQEIRKTLDQFDHAEKLPPNPYFYTRVKARIEEKNRKQGIFSTILKPALLTVLIALNLFTAAWYLGGSDQKEQTGSREQLIEILAGDLELENDQSNLFFTE